MLKTIKNICGQDIGYLKSPLVYSVVEGALLAAPYIVLAFLLPGLLLAGQPDNEFWVSYGLIALFFALRIFVTRKSYSGGMQAGYRAGAAIRLNMGEHLRKLPMGFFSQRDTGELVNRLFQNVGMVEMMIGHFMSQAVSNLAAPLALLAFLLITAPFLSGVMLLTLVAAFPLFYVLIKMVDKDCDKRVQMLDVANSRILEYLHGITVFKAFNQTGMGFTRLARALAELRDFSIRFELKSFAASLVYSAVLEMGFVVLIYAGWQMIAGGMMEPYGLLIFLILALRFYRPLHRFAENAALTRGSFSGAKAIHQVFEEKEIPAPEKRPVELSNFEIRFDRVSFGYKGKKVLHDFSFVAPEKTMTALVGPSGSGKSTVTKLIARFWDVDQGAVKIGGVDARDLPPEILLGNMSMVFQDVYLFNDTILNNIRIGNPEASLEEVRKVAREALCHDFIEAFPKGYQTVIGEGGATLSGGEKQRIAIARAMLKNAPIVLLDEATASLDPENDRLIQKAVERLVKSKNLIVIAHRLHTIVKAGQIIVLEDGRITQKGDHEELIKQNGWYAQMWQEQKSRVALRPKRNHA
ncbi:ABC transporter ATP-binding protein [Dethiosulfatarculus sandiegensis]|uniref:Multidrug ABC transporter n=1 Tax=Dethiosulfatarculus sandiegensis TaxID=1429043 RepID=A0A0D2GH80_9BACT|nr:ABC transporter ATP-binding protein [Dethiosulfatarculus sandiegensis]KIX14277.1 multidrug ABC transporter [Dethiosulfatarculus sandiegensis]